MAKVQIKSKEAKARAAASGGKGRRKKWSKGKTREKLNNAVLFDAKNYERLLSEVPKMKLITPSSISERLKITGSLARKSIADLLNQGIIKPIIHHNTQLIYTKA